jgi:hypothetical protein
MTRAACGSALLLCVVGACSGGSTPGPIDADGALGADAATANVADGDASGHDGAPVVGDDAASPGNGPRVVFLHYADGQPLAGFDGRCRTFTPPPFGCSPTRSPGPEGCKAIVQEVLDRWYGDFNVRFTRQKPTVGSYYTLIISNDYSACGSLVRARAVGSVAPITCDDLGAGTAWVFASEEPEETATSIAQAHGYLVGLVKTVGPGVMNYCTQKPCVGFPDQELPVAAGATCSRTTQNSYRMMKERLGARP